MPVSQDADLMNDLESRIDEMYIENPAATIKIWNKIVDILPRLSQHSRVYYILNELYDYIDMKVESWSPVTMTVPKPMPQTVMHSDTANQMNDGMHTDSDMNSENMDTMSDENMQENMEDGEVDIDVEIDITWAWLSFSMEEIRVVAWDVVKINFMSNWWYHDWVVDEFDAATAKVSEWDDMVSVTFVANEIGTFEYYCSVGNHRAAWMVWNLIVE